jgi:hypothetical protein
LKRERRSAAAECKRARYGGAGGEGNEGGMSDDE